MATPDQASPVKEKGSILEFEYGPNPQSYFATSYPSPIASAEPGDFRKRHQYGFLSFYFIILTNIIVKAFQLPSQNFSKSLKMTNRGLDHDQSM
jgi:hypothetical protein